MMNKLNILYLKLAYYTMLTGIITVSIIAVVTN